MRKESRLNYEERLGPIWLKELV